MCSLLICPHTQNVASYLFPGCCVPHPRLIENCIMWDIVEGRTGKTWKKSTAQTFLLYPWWFFCLRQNLVAGVWRSGLMTTETKDGTFKQRKPKSLIIFLVGISVNSSRFNLQLLCIQLPFIKHQAIFCLFHLLFHIKDAVLREHSF